MHACTHLHHVCIHASLHTFLHAGVHDMHGRIIHACIHACMHTYINTCAHRCIIRCVHTYSQTQTQTHPHTHTHRQTNKHTHTHTRAILPLDKLGSHDVQSFQHRGVGCEEDSGLASCHIYGQSSCASSTQEFPVHLTQSFVGASCVRGPRAPCI